MLSRRKKEVKKHHKLSLTELELKVLNYCLDNSNISRLSYEERAAFRTLQHKAEK